MTRAWLRRTFALIVGAAFAVSISASTVQATAATLAMASAMAANDGMCPDCDQHEGKSMPCQDFVCSAPSIALPAPTTVVRVRSRALDLPVVRPATLTGWTRAPDLHPPTPLILD